MGKHEHKRKRQYAHKQANQKIQQPRLLNSEVVSAKDQPESPPKGDSHGYNKKGASVGFSEAVKRSNITDWCIALFTGALVGTSIYQFVIMGGQLDVMRKDQRPWVKLKFDTFVLGVNSPIGGNLHIIGNGKTPAKNVKGKFAIEKVRNGEQPRLDYGSAWSKFTGGALFPDDPQTQALNMQQTVQHPAGPSYEAAILTQSDWDDYAQGKIFFVAYASISYSDFFRVEHWTRYCVFLSAPESPASVSPKQFTAQNCTDYNDVDDN